MNAIIIYVDNINISINMINFYYLIAGIAYGIFILQFLISQFFGDVDVDIDADGDADFDITSLVSFKGLIHFCMGCFGWLSLKQFNMGHVTYMDWFLGFLIGIIFLIVLYFIYKLATKFNHVPKTDSNLVGKTGIIKFVTEEGYCVSIINNGEVQELITYSNTKHNSGEAITIKELVNGRYYI